MKTQCYIIIFPATLWLILQNAAAYGQTFGLAPSTNASGRAEALTSGAIGTDALFYNPALLVRAPWSARLLSLEGARGLDESKVPDGFLDKPSLIEALKILEDSDSIYVSVSARALDLTTPYSGITSFAKTSLEIADNRSSTGTYSLNSTSDLGAAVGFGVLKGKFSLGYSHYVLSRAQIIATPSAVDAAQAVQASESGQVGQTTQIVRNFTETKFGSALGHNAGANYTFRDDNQSGIGLALLNIGDSKFRSSIPYKHKEITRIESQIEEEARTNGVELVLPDAIKQQFNAGGNLSLADNDSYLDAILTADYFDIGGLPGKRRFAGSWQLGLKVPDEHAVKSAVPIIMFRHLQEILGDKPSGPYGAFIHMGLSHLRVFGGYREKSYVTRGASLGLHFGMNYLVSIAKLEGEIYEKRGVTGSYVTPEVGGRVALSFVLLY